MDYVFEKFLKYPLQTMLATLVVGIICAFYVWSWWSLAVILFMVIAVIAEFAILLGYILTVCKAEQWADHNP
jgi:ABC-type transport system involved in cytochrome bd biosynthesis fused ATPase/permease subunit